MKRVWIFACVLSLLTSCDSKLDNNSIPEFGYDVIIEDLVKYNNFKVTLNVEGNSEKLGFYISDSQCLDCVLKNLKLLSKSIVTGEINREDVILLTNYNDKKMLAAHLMRSELEGLNVITSKASTIFESLDNLYDLPTFFIYDPNLEIGHSMFQATLGKEHLSSILIRIYSQRL